MGRRIVGPWTLRVSGETPGIHDFEENRLKLFIMWLLRWSKVARKLIGKLVCWLPWGKLIEFNTCYTLKNLINILLYSLFNVDLQNNCERMPLVLFFNYFKEDVAEQNRLWMLHSLFLALQLSTFLLGNHKAAPIVPVHYLDGSICPLRIEGIGEKGDVPQCSPQLGGMVNLISRINKMGFSSCQFC